MYLWVCVDLLSDKNEELAQLDMWLVARQVYYLVARCCVSGINALRNKEGL